MGIKNEFPLLLAGGSPGAMVHLQSVPVSTSPLVLSCLLMVSLFRHHYVFPSSNAYASMWDILALKVLDVLCIYSQLDCPNLCLNAFSRLWSTYILLTILLPHDTPGQRGPKFEAKETGKNVLGGVLLLAPTWPGILYCNTPPTVLRNFDGLPVWGWASQQLKLSHANICAYEKSYLVVSVFHWSS